MSSCTGRSPYGERGLKLERAAQDQTSDVGRSPYGERGLKYDGFQSFIRRDRSLSLRRAWIEIVDTVSMVVYTTGRSPYGERGLKYRAWFLARSGVWSLSLRRAWIEIAMHDCVRNVPCRSLSLRRAWIEMITCETMTMLSKGRSPYGERGLKFQR